MPTPEKIDQLTLDNVSYDIDLPADNRISKYSAHVYSSISGTPASYTDVSAITSAIWTVTDTDISTLYDGLKLTFKIPTVIDPGYGVGLKINDMTMHPILLNSYKSIDNEFKTGDMITVVYNSSKAGTLYAGGSSPAPYQGVWEIVNTHTTTASYICSSVANSVLRSAVTDITTTTNLTDVDGRILTYSIFTNPVLGYDSTKFELNVGDMIYVLEKNYPNRYVSEVKYNTSGQRTGVVLSTTSAFIYDSNVNWGGPALADTVSPTDAGCIAEIGTNRLAFLESACMIIEYSTDGGTTWNSYPTTAAEMNTLVTGNAPYGSVDINFTVGHVTSTGVINSSNYSDYKIRVTLDSRIGRGASTVEYIYTQPKRWLFEVDKNGANDCTVVYQQRTMNSWEANIQAWDAGSTYSIDGSPGWNSIPSNSDFFGGPYSSLDNTASVRFTFSIGGVSSNPDDTNALALLGIRLIGTEIQKNSSNYMMKNGHLYAFDHLKNATFPRDIYPTGSGALGASNKPWNAYISNLYDTRTVEVDPNIGAIGYFENLGSQANLLKKCTLSALFNSGLPATNVYTVVTDYVTGGTLSGSLLVLQGKTSQVQIIPDSGHTLPSGISVAGLSSYSYNATSGIITLTNPNSNVSIIAVCPATENLM